MEVPGTHASELSVARQRLFGQVIIVEPAPEVMYLH